MADVLPREQGVKRSILQWLDGLRWETYGQDDEKDVAISDSEGDCTLRKTIFWNIRLGYITERRKPEV